MSPTTIFGEEDNKLLYDEKIHKTWEWDKLLSNGIVEFVDPDEEEEALIAMKPNNLEEQSHIRTTKLSQEYVLACMRVSFHFQITIKVQEIATSRRWGSRQLVPISNSHNDRIDSYSHVLWYPQKPLIATQMTKNIGYDALPSGEKRNCSDCFIT